MTDSELTIALSRGSTLFVRQYGRGIPVLCVHGFPLDHSMWRQQWEGLGDQFLFLAPDLAGFGRSILADDTQATDASLESDADDLAELLDRMGHARVVFCGLSMGGYVGWQFWRRHPARVAGFVLCDTRAAADTPEVARGRRVMAERILKEGMEILVEPMLPRLFSNATLTAPDARIFGLIQRMRSCSPLAAARVLMAMANRPDMEALLPTIDLPTLLLCGEEDVITPPAEMQQMAARMPQAKLQRIPSAGHLAPAENAALVNRAIREFLDRLPQP